MAGQAGQGAVLAACRHWDCWSADGRKRGGLFRHAAIGENASGIFAAVGIHLAILGRGREHRRVCVTLATRFAKHLTVGAAVPTPRGNAQRDPPPRAGDGASPTRMMPQANLRRETASGRRRNDSGRLIRLRVPMRESPGYILIRKTAPSGGSAALIFFVCPPRLTEIS